MKENSQIVVLEPLDIIIIKTEHLRDERVLSTRVSKYDSKCILFI